MKISKKDVEHMAELARLDLSEPDKEKFSREFSDILGYVEKLNEIDVGKVKSGRGWLVDPAFAQGFGGQGPEYKERVNKMREDIVTRGEGEEVRDRFVRLAPENDGKLIKTISPLK